jgi:hypothetical protein
MWLHGAREYRTVKVEQDACEAITANFDADGAPACAVYLIDGRRLP